MLSLMLSGVPDGKALGVVLGLSTYQNTFNRHAYVQADEPHSAEAEMRKYAVILRVDAIDILKAIQHVNAFNPTYLSVPIRTYPTTLQPRLWPGLGRRAPRSLQRRHCSGGISR